MDYDCRHVVSKDEIHDIFEEENDSRKVTHDVHACQLIRNLVLLINYKRLCMVKDSDPMATNMLSQGTKVAPPQTMIKQMKNLKYHHD